MEQQLLTLKFMAREDVEAILSEPFAPDNDKIDVLLEGTDIGLTYPLSDLACIQYQVHIPPKQNYRTGFFGVPFIPTAGSNWRSPPAPRSPRPSRFIMPRSKTKSKPKSKH